jgi:hypothetical protein
LSSDKSPKSTDRRSFIKFLGAAGIGLVAGIGLAEYIIPPRVISRNVITTLASTLTTTESFPVSQIAIDGAAIPKYVDPVPTFVGTRVDASQSRDLTVNSLEFQQKILPEDLYRGLG